MLQCKHSKFIFTRKKNVLSYKMYAIDISQNIDNQFFISEEINSNNQPQ